MTRHFISTSLLKNNCKFTIRCPQHKKKVMKRYGISVVTESASSSGAYRVIAHSKENKEELWVTVWSSLTSVQPPASNNT